MQGFWRKPRQQRWRGWTFEVHLWSGLILGLWAIVIGLSGSALVFEEEIQRAVEPELHIIEPGVAPQRLSTIVETIRAHFPQHQVHGFRGIDEVERSHVAYIARREEPDGKPVDWRYIHYDPYTGRILGVEQDGEGFFPFLQDLHYNLLAGAIGRQINGALAVGLLLMCLTGIVIWWPGPSGWKRALSVKWAAGWKRVNYDLHSAVGFYSAAVLAALSFTGLFFAFPLPIVLFFTMVSGGDIEDVQAYFVPPRSTVVEDAPVYPLDQVMARQSELMPADFALVGIDLPAGKEEGIYRLNGRLGDNPLLVSLGGAFVDQYSGELLGDYDTRLQPWGIQLVLTFTPIHFGTFGGLWSKALWFMVGFAPGGLFLSGFFMWWNRVAGKRYQAWKRQRRAGDMGEPPREGTAR
ncbi:MAG: hypothetical protein GC160_12430 [Acidobacteria bacterium]|nr:hypothetical protein [Acidobacteriota bacterium]